MKTLQQIQIEQVSIGDLRPDPAMKRIEEINQAGMGVGALNIYSFKSRNQVCPHARIIASFPNKNPNRF